VEVDDVVEKPFQLTGSALNVLFESFLEVEVTGCHTDFHLDDSFLKAAPHKCAAGQN
jgi:hypothetical protein